MGFSRNDFVLWAPVLLFVLVVIRLAISPYARRDSSSYLVLLSMGLLIWGLVLLRRTERGLKP